MTQLLPSTPVLFAFLGASLAMLVIPGPSVVYVVARSLEQGRRAGLYSMLGLETGAAVHVLAAAVGLAAVLASSEVAFTAVRWAGAGYLVWLASKELRARRGVLRADLTPPGTAGPLRLYADGVLIDVLNPKTAIFFLAFLPQFVDPSRGAAAAQLAVLGLLFVVLAGLVDSTYAVLAGRLSGRLRSSPQAQHRLRRATGSVYLALAGVAVLA
jgi:threonine/homoserine/homoserine lactone efflux protein